MYLQQDGGFGVNQTFLRFAASLELIKFLFDYHGFVPFLGVRAPFDHFEFNFIQFVYYLGR